MYVSPHEYDPFLNPAVDEIKGYDATIGFTAWANKPSNKDAVVCSKHCIRSFLPHHYLSLSLKSNLLEPLLS